MERPNVLTLSQAANLTGINKSRLHRAIKTGTMSADQPDAGGQYEIERSELERVFPPNEWPVLNEKQERSRDDGSLPVPEPSSDDRSAVLAVKLEIAEERLAEIKNVLARERERADRAEDERRWLLEAPRTEIERERAERDRERQEAAQRDEERRNEAERLRNDLERARQEQDRLAREAEELRQALLKPKGFWARLRG